MINSNYSLTKEGTIYVVKDLFEQDFADKMEDEIKKICKDWWSVVIFPANQYFLKQVNRHYDHLDQDTDFIIQKKYNKDWFDSGNFAYTFKRDVGDHYPGCYCVQCNLRKYFDSDEVKDELSKIVGKKVTKFENTFTSKYENGDFLSMHSDLTNGDYAFVFQLTKDWNPVYGGLLNFYDSNTKEIYKTINPIFNSLVIFKIDDNITTNHFVSMNVSSHTRYAYSGWFSVSNE